MEKYQNEIEKAMSASDAYTTCWNQRDQEGMADSLNYPHIRFASGSV